MATEPRWWRASVSEDDMLTIANGAEIRVADLTRSDLKSGRLEIVKSVFAPNNVCIP